MPFKSDRQRKAFFAQQGGSRSPNTPIIISSNSKSDAERRGVFIEPLNLKSNRLPVQVGIAVPSTELDKKITDKKFRKRINDEKKFFSKTFGGDTSIKAVGSFVKDSMQMMH